MVYNIFRIIYFAFGQPWEELMLLIRKINDYSLGVYAPSGDIRFGVIHTTGGKKGKFSPDTRMQLRDFDGDELQQIAEKCKEVAKS